MAAVDVLREAFRAERVVVEEHLRGSDPQIGRASRFSRSAP
jgi:S-adenosylmethionine/arginine decarboxylase-like enzyme